MNAPDKIFIDKDCNFNEHDSFIAWSYEPPFASVEYIRKDALLEFAMEQEENIVSDSLISTGKRKMLERLINKLNSM